MPWSNCPSGSRVAHQDLVGTEVTILHPSRLRGQECSPTKCLDNHDPRFETRQSPLHVPPAWPLPEPTAPQSGPFYSSILLQDADRQDIWLHSASKKPSTRTHTNLPTRLAEIIPGAVGGGGNLALTNTGVWGGFGLAKKNNVPSNARIKERKKLAAAVVLLALSARMLRSCYHRTQVRIRNRPGSCDLDVSLTHALHDSFSCPAGPNVSFACRSPSGNTSEPGKSLHSSKTSI